MNKKSLCVATLLSLFSSVVGSQAATYTFTPSTADLKDLDHYWAAEWGINFSLGTNEKIASASILFDNIRDWTKENNDLYVSLLDNSQQSLSYYWDNQAYGNYFANKGIQLQQYHNLSNVAQDITYNFSSTDLTTLSKYLSTPSSSGYNIGLGFDADCHYYNDGISFKIVTSTESDPVPEPATMVLFGLGMAGIGYCRTRNRS